VAGEVIDDLSDWLADKSGGQQALILLPFVVFAGGLYYLFWWHWADPIAAAVDPLPVLSTVAGWLLPGGVVVAAAVNFLAGRGRHKVEIALWTWGALALICFPQGFGGFFAVEHRAFWTGLACGTLAFTVMVFGKPVSERLDDRLSDRDKGLFLLTVSTGLLFLAALIR
jgi:hypothetical protein